MSNAATQRRQEGQRDKGHKSNQKQRGGGNRDGKQESERREHIYIILYNIILYYIIL